MPPLPFLAAYKFKERQGLLGLTISFSFNTFKTVVSSCVFVFSWKRGGTNTAAALNQGVFFMAYEVDTVFLCSLRKSCVEHLT